LEITRRKLLALGGGCSLAGSVLALGGQQGAKKARRAWTREGRERFAIKAVNSTLPVEILDVIHEQGRFDVAQVVALIEVESNGYYKKVSPAGAVGVMQVMPIHANKVGLAVDDLYDPVVNVRLGLQVLWDLHKRYKGREYYYVSAYNCGHGTWGKILDGKKRINSETLNHWRKYRKMKKHYRDWLVRGEWVEYKGYGYEK
jgi:soluble lytic murein transglycosylase-like protein